MDHEHWGRQVPRPLRPGLRVPGCPTLIPRTGTGTNIHQISLNLLFLLTAPDSQFPFTCPSLFLCPSRYQVSGVVASTFDSPTRTKHPRSSTVHYYPLLTFLEHKDTAAVPRYSAFLPAPSSFVHIYQHLSPKPLRSLASSGTHVAPCFLFPPTSHSYLTITKDNALLRRSNFTWVWLLSLVATLRHLGQERESETQARKPKEL